MKANVDGNFYDKGGNTGLLTSSYNELTQIVEVLRKAEVNVDAQNKYGILLVFLLLSIDTRKF